MNKMNILNLAGVLRAVAIINIKGIPVCEEILKNMLEYLNASLVDCGLSHIQEDINVTLQR